MKILKSLLFGVASLITFALCAYALIYDRSASAGVAGALSLAFLMLSLSPNFETFEILTLKVKLREKLDDAEKLLGFLRQSATVSAKITYIQLAYMNRMGDIGWSRKRQLLGEIDNHLIDLSVPRELINSFKVPFLNIASLDLYRVFTHTLDSVLKKYFDQHNATIQELQREGAHDNERISQLIELRNSYVAPADKFEDVLSDPALSDLQALTDRVLDRYDLAEHDKQKLAVVQREVVQLSRSCWEAGTITPESEHYLLRYRPPANKRFEELEGR